MATINIGIGHDDYLVIANFLHVQRFLVFQGPNRYAQSGVHILDFFAIKYTVFHCLFYVMNFASQRKYGLIAAISTLLCSSTC